MNELEELKESVKVLKEKVDELIIEKELRDSDLMGNENWQYEDWLVNLNENEAWVIDWNRQHSK